VKKVALRTAIVLGNEPGSVFDYLKKISWLGLGGRMASGRQKMSWIHVDDFCRVIEWMIGKEEMQDFYNLSAPNPTDNAGCMAEFRRIAGRGFGLPATKWMLKIGTFLMRSETELVLKSRWVLPGRLEEEGFRFKWAEFDEALSHLESRPGTV
jgi:NAD dependent epimerase/dehydratase family enzyme